MCGDLWHCADLTYRSQCNLGCGKTSSPVLREATDALGRNDLALEAYKRLLSGV